MTEIAVESIKALRAQTGAGPMKCKEALKETNGNIEEAAHLLRKRGIASASKKADRATNEGIISSYIHVGGRIGVMIKLLCETSFVAQNEEFTGLAKDLCVHIAVSNPAYLKRDEVPQDIIEKEKEVAREQSAGKPEAAIEKITEGKVEKFFAEHCLLEQKYIKDSSMTIQDYLSSKIAKTGENILIERFVRMQM